LAGSQVTTEALQTKNKLEEEDSTMEIQAALEAEGAKVNPRPGAPHPDLRRWIRQTMGGAAIAATLHGAPAHADAYCSSLHGVQNSVNVGVHLGFAFGALGWPVKLNYGVTLRLGRQAAGFARIEGLGISAFHLTAGATGIIGESAFLEGGLTKSIGMGSAAGLHLGTGPANNAVGLLLGGFIPVVGPSSDWSAQIAPFLFPREICFPSGRALRVGASVALPPVLAGPECPSADKALAAGWVDDARAELASVPAFLRLAAELEVVGAPADLRRDAIAAADDEQRHAAAALALASRWSGGVLALGPLVAPPRFDRPSEAALTALALEAWQDGCLGEGTAALAARQGLARARDPQATRALSRIAPDEERHAELSWRIVEWALRTGVTRVRDAVADAVLGATVLCATAEEDAELLAWNGRLTAAERNQARAEIEDEARRRVRLLLDTTA